MLQRVIALGLFILFLPGLIACRSEPEPVATPTPAIPPLEIASQAADAMLAVESLHFIIERSGALAYIDADGLLAFKRAEGDFARPDRLRAIVRIVTAFTPVEIGMVVLGAEQFATDPITGHWEPLPPEWGQFNLAVLFDPEIGIRGLLQKGILELRFVGRETQEGQPHYHLAGRADGEQVSAMTLGFIGGGDVDLEVWVGVQDFYVRRLYIIETDSDADNPTTWDLTFSKLGQPVEIQAPPVALP